MTTFTAIFRNMIKKTLQLIGDYMLLMKRVFQKPERWRIFGKQLILEADKLVIQSIPLIALISVFIGGVIVMQTALNLVSPFIPKMYVGYMARESLILEFCSTMVCLILAGKIGSNISSEIGSMRITEQIDAMEMMGVNSANYLILPKVVAATLLNPFLMLMSFFLGLVGGWFIVYTTGIIQVSDYLAASNTGSWDTMSPTASSRLRSSVSSSRPSPHSTGTMPKGDLWAWDDPAPRPS